MNKVILNFPIKKKPYQYSADTIPITTDTSSVSSKTSKKESSSKNEVIGKYHVSYTNYLVLIFKVFFIN